MPANAGSQHVTICFVLLLARGCCCSCTDVLAARLSIFTISEQTRAWKGTGRDHSRFTTPSRQENVGYPQSLSRDGLVDPEWQMGLPFPDSIALDNVSPVFCGQIFAEISSNTNCVARRPDEHRSHLLSGDGAGFRCRRGKHGCRSKFVAAQRVGDDDCRRDCCDPTGNHARSGQC